MVKNDQIAIYQLHSLGIISAFSLESNALKGPLWLARWLARWPAASKTRQGKHVETSGVLH